MPVQTISPPRRLRHKRKAKETNVGAAGSRRSRLRFWSSAALILGTIALYSPVSNHEFLNYDDDVYVSANPHVTQGLTWRSVRWSLSTFEQANWHPVTWLSHAIDCQLFGLDSGYHHLVSVLIHGLNVGLLFLLLEFATGEVGMSFLVAALFACHPFNVQTVAWVAERKNVLSMLFLLLTLGAYGRYARNPQTGRLLAVLFAYVLALASKPMVVTLPVMLLFLDYWPLGRVAGRFPPTSFLSIPQRSIPSLILEKIPLLLPSTASSVVTVVAQQSGNALRSLQTFPLGARVANATCAYLAYIGKTFWPSRLAVYYPHPGTSLALWKPFAASSVLIGTSMVIWNQRRTRPYLVAGWAWFVTALVPVIGIVQVGDQAMADRYAYLPLIGIFVGVTWGAKELLGRYHASASLGWATAMIVLGVLSAVTVREITYWQDSVSLWSHTVEVTPQNATAEKQLASALAVRGDQESAMPHFLNVARLNPQDLPTHVNIGVYYAGHGRREDAIREFAKVVELTDRELGERRTMAPEDRDFRASSLLDMGTAYSLAKNFQMAILSFQLAAQANLAMADGMMERLRSSLGASAPVGSYVTLCLLQRARGKNYEASTTLADAIEAYPGDADLGELSRYLHDSR